MVQHICKIVSSGSLVFVNCMLFFDKYRNQQEFVSLFSTENKQQLKFNPVLVNHSLMHTNDEDKWYMYNIINKFQSFCSVLFLF